MNGLELIDYLINHFSQSENNIGFKLSPANHELGLPGTIDIVYYKDPQTRCNIGALLPLEKAQELENFQGTVTSLFSYKDCSIDFRDMLVDENIDDTVDFLQTIQTVHDCFASFYEAWPINRKQWFLNKVPEQYREKLSRLIEVLAIKNIEFRTKVGLI